MHHASACDFVNALPGKFALEFAQVRDVGAQQSRAGARSEPIRAQAGGHKPAFAGTVGLGVRIRFDAAVTVEDDEQLKSLSWEVSCCDGFGELPALGSEVRARGEISSLQRPALDLDGLRRAVPDS